MKIPSKRSGPLAFALLVTAFGCSSAGGAPDEVGGGTGVGGDGSQGGAHSGGSAGSHAGTTGKSGSGGAAGSQSAGGHAGTPGKGGSGGTSAGGHDGGSAGIGGQSGGNAGVGGGASGANGGDGGMGGGLAGAGGSLAGSGGESGSGGDGGGAGGSLGGNGGVTGGSSGSAGSAGSSGNSGSSGSAGSGGSGGNSGGAGAGGASGSAGSAGAAGNAGAGGGGGPGWPTCDAQPAGIPLKTIHQVWQDNPAKPTGVWVPGVFVTAISYGACTANIACEIFVQQEQTFADLAAGSQQAIKMFISANTSQHFVGIKVGDQVDVYASAWRYNVTGQNELLLQVSLQLPGCAKPVGTGVPVPVAAALTDLTISSYEDTIGPLLIQVPTVSGNPPDSGSIFALWDTATGPSGGLTNATSLTPFYLAGGHFAGFTYGKIHDFSYARGVFSLYLEPTTMTKYKTIGPRTIDEAPILKVHPLGRLVASHSTP